MNRIFGLAAAIMLLGATTSYAGNLTTINYTKEAPNYTPVQRAPAGAQSAWICSMYAGGWCQYWRPTYLGGPCACCGPYGCTPGVVTGVSSLTQKLRSLATRK
jgi:hypothetical protein